MLVIWEYVTLLAYAKGKCWWCVTNETNAALHTDATSASSTTPTAIVLSSNSGADTESLKLNVCLSE